MESQKKYDVIALGRLLIDFTPTGTNAQGNLVLEQNPKGAPCSVLATSTRYGRNAGFIGKIGSDAHGRFLRRAARESGVDYGGFVMLDEVHTTFAFVSIDESGNRGFSLYHNPGAGMALTEDEVNLDMIRCSRVFHFGTLSMTHEGARKATIRVAACARESGCLVSSNPNLRPPLQVGMEETRRQMLYGISLYHILRIIDEELRFMTGTEDEKQVVGYLQAAHGIPLILVTARAFESMACWIEETLRAEASLTDRTIDITGAGDVFCGCRLNYLLDRPLEALDQESVRNVLAMASAVASIVTIRGGAFKSMSEPGEVEEVVRQR